MFSEGKTKITFCHDIVLINDEIALGQDIAKVNSFVFV
jgi:hypothetical protein